MVKIELLIKPFKLVDVQAALGDLEVEVTMISEIRDRGAATERAFYRGATYGIAGVKTKVEMLTSSERADEVVDALLRAARTGTPGDDGTILVYEVADAVRIRTGARLQYTLH